MWLDEVGEKIVQRQFEPKMVDQRCVREKVCAAFFSLVQPIVTVHGRIKIIIHLCPQKMYH